MNTHLIEDYMADLMDPVSSRVVETGPVLVVVPKQAPKEAPTVAEAAPVAIPPPAPAPSAAPVVARPVVAAPVPAMDPRILAMLPPTPEALESGVPAQERRRRAADLIVRWLRFYMGGQAYAVEVLKVQEVLRVPDIMPLRGTESALLGVMNLRGQIVPVIDLGNRLKLPPITMDADTRVVVVESEGEALGLLVSSVAEVVAISEGRVEHPAALKVGTAVSLHGVYRQSDSQITILLDAACLVG